MTRCIISYACEEEKKIGKTSGKNHGYFEGGLRKEVGYKLDERSIPMKALTRMLTL